MFPKSNFPSASSRSVDLVHYQYHHLIRAVWLRSIKSNVSINCLWWSQICAAEETSRKTPVQHSPSSWARVQDYTCIGEDRSAGTKDICSLHGYQCNWYSILHHGVLGWQDYRRCVDAGCQSSGKKRTVCIQYQTIAQLIWFSWHEAIRTLAKFHQVDPKAVGLDDYGRASGFYNRQIKTLSKVSGVQSQARDKDTDEPVGDIPHFQEMVQFFSNKNIQPQDRSTLVHGDYKIDNVVFHKTEPRVIGILEFVIQHISQHR